MTPRPGGWTLLELLAVLAITAVLAAWAAPALQRVTLRARLVTTSNDLAHGLYLARHTAVTTQRHTSFCAGSIDTGCTGDWAAGRWIVFFDGDHDGQPNQRTDVLISGTTNGKLSISGNGPFRKAVEFTPLGISQWSSGAFGAGRLRVCAAARLAPNATELILAATGRVRLKHPDFGGQCPLL